MIDLWRALHPHLPLWLGLFWAAYLFWLAGWIVLQKREPVATLSWIMSLALLPLLGLLIYHVLGPQRIRRTRLKRLAARARVGLPIAGVAPSSESPSAGSAGAGQQRLSAQFQPAGAIAGRWRGDLRRPGRRHLAGDRPCPYRVLHLRCRRDRRPRSRCAGRTRPRRGQGSPAARCAWLRGRVTPVPGAAAGGRRRGGLLPPLSSATTVEPAPEPAQPSQDRGHRRRHRLHRRHQHFRHRERGAAQGCLP